jgi:hypothetical protein
VRRERRHEEKHLYFTGGGGAWAGSGGAGATTGSHGSSGAANIGGTSEGERRERMVGFADVMKPELK